MKRYLLSSLFVALLFFSSNNISFANYNTYNQGSYCTEAQYNQLKAQYDSIVQKMHAANPYTQLAQKAPLQIDPNQLQGRQGLDRATASIANIYGVNPINTTQNLINEAQQQRMAQTAAQTGLTPEEFIAGQTMNYNTAANFYMKQMEQYQELMTQCLKNMRRQQNNNYMYY